MCGGAADSSTSRTATTAVAAVTRAPGRFSAPHRCGNTPSTMTSLRATRSGIPSSSCRSVASVRFADSAPHRAPLTVSHRRWLAGNRPSGCQSRAVPSVPAHHFFPIFFVHTQ